MRDMRKQLAMGSWRLSRNGRAQLLHVRAIDTEMFEGETVYSQQPSPEIELFDG